jgi:phosphoribosylglycinamide formyltransferase-1
MKKDDFFSYNFAHRKTEDFLIHCYLNNVKVDAIIATGWKELNVPSVPFRTKLKIPPKYNPKELASKFEIPYFELDHDSEECLNLLDKIKPKIGIITGARIIKEKVIRKFEIGIINIHPGDIPKIRGLNSSLRAIKLNHPQFVTSHLIDRNIDLSKILLKKEVKTRITDTIFDINENLYQAQIEILIESILKAEQKKFIISNNENTSYDGTVPFDNYIEFKSALNPI